MYNVIYREEWKLVTELPSHEKSKYKYFPIKKYEISNFGRIKKNGKLITPSIWKNKYYYTVIRCNCDKGYVSIPVYIHRLVAYYFVDGYSIELTVNHKNGDRFENFDSNLEWVTDEYNKKHAHQIGLVPTKRGSNIGTSKVSEDEVIEAAKLLVLGLTYTEIINEIPSMTQNILIKIRNKDSWTHITKDFNFPDMVKSFTKLPSKLIHLICKDVAIYDNKTVAKKYKKDISKYTKTRPSALIYRIRNKVDFRNISDKYF